MVDEKMIRETLEKFRKDAGFLRRNLRKGDYVFNASNTSDEKALNGQSWVEYWKQMTGKDLPELCPLCGQSLSAGDADGCHIVFPKGIEILFGVIKDDTWRPKYIIPAHHKCNCQFGSLKEIKYPVEACFAFPRMQK